MIKKDLKIVVIPFCYRQFDLKNKKTSTIDSTIEDFQTKVNEQFHESLLKPGYADFCKHIFLENWTNTVLDYAEITPENKKDLL